MTLKTYKRLLLGAIFSIIGARFLTLSIYPLFGTTEPRYAELARKILVTGDWVTLWASDGVPLWGKPPLLFWLDAISMRLLGINEFALRFPPFIASILVLTLFWFWPNQDKKYSEHWYNNQPSLIASLIYLSTPLGFLATGFVATDIFLTAGVCLSMVSFWHVIKSRIDTKQIASTHSKIWGLLFFVGMAVGVLSKGPVAIVLTGGALFVWALGDALHRFKIIFKSLPWLSGICLLFIIASPWYILAEIRTPGFLYHFIIGEHVERFLVKDWAGGRYAPSHGEPLGMIWWFTLESLLPWIVMIPSLLYKLRKTTIIKNDNSVSTAGPVFSHETKYLLSWFLTPLVFFSFSHNILEAYVLPSLPAFALVIGNGFSSLIERAHRWRSLLLIVSFIIPIFLTSIFVFNPTILESQSQKHILEKWELGTPLYYIHGVPASAVFYSHNQAKSIESLEDIDQKTNLGNAEKQTTVVMHQSVFARLTASQKSHWKFIEQYSEYIMLRK